MKAAFEKGKKISETTTDIVVDIMYMDSNPEVRAKAFFVIWNNANSSRQATLIKDIKELGMDSERFVNEFMRNGGVGLSNNKSGIKKKSGISKTGIIKKANIIN